MRNHAVRGAIVLISLVSCFGSTGAFADEMKWRAVTYVSKFDVKPVGDVEGHVAGTFVRRGLALFEQGDVAVVVNTGTIDVTKGAGTYKGEGTYTFEDGSSFTAGFQGALQPPPAGGKVAHKGSGEILGGAGRFDGIKGNFTFTGKSMTPYGAETKSETYYDTTATYTLPKK